MTAAPWHCPRPQYHHGDLKQALRTRALALITEQGAGLPSNSCAHAVWPPLLHTAYPFSGRCQLQDKSYSRSNQQVNGLR